MEKERYQIFLNYEGQDVPVIVDDIQMAGLLLNDISAARQFIENQINMGTLQMPADESEQEENTQDQSPAATQCEIIWTKKKPTERDIEATALLLAEIQRLGSLFDDKKTKKSKLWNDISKKLGDNNFYLGEKGGEKCRQKFANLQKAYLQYVKHQNTTGAERNDDVPAFFDQMHSILGGKHKVNPVLLEDSMESIDIINSPEDEGIPTEVDDKQEFETADIRPSTSKQENETGKENKTPTTSKDFSQRFKAASRKITPSRQDEIIKEIEKDRVARNEEFSFIKPHLKKSEEQIDRFINVIERAFLSKKKKKRGK